jgi:ketol-acid reductoisomerase
MDYINACSTTARPGALDWALIFEKLYKCVRDGTETRNALGYSMYHQDLTRELKEILRAGKTVHSLLPDYKP